MMYENKNFSKHFWGVCLEWILLHFLLFQIFPHVHLDYFHLECLKLSQYIDVDTVSHVYYFHNFLKLNIISILAGKSK